jgi:DNA-binding CsgD family transcriptional regulator
VKFHVASVLGKLGASGRAEAVTRGVRQGLISV